MLAARAPLLDWRLPAALVKGRSITRSTTLTRLLRELGHGPETER
jgi:hypothetical protein